MGEIPTRIAPASLLPLFFREMPVAATTDDTFRSQRGSGANGLPAARSGAPRTTVLVSSHPELVAADSVMVDSDVIVMSTIHGGYGCVTRIKPDAVVLLMTIDDQAGCQLLTMLRLDPELAGVEIVDCALPPMTTGSLEPQSAALSTASEWSAASAKRRT